MNNKNNFNKIVEEFNNRKNEYWTIRENYDLNVNDEILLLEKFSLLLDMIDLDTEIEVSKDSERCLGEKDGQDIIEKTLEISIQLNGENYGLTYDSLTNEFRQVWFKINDFMVRTIEYNKYSYDEKYNTAFNSLIEKMYQVKEINEMQKELNVIKPDIEFFNTKQKKFREFIDSANSQLYSIVR